MATTKRRFVLNAPSIAGDTAGVTYVVLSASGATLVASTGSGVVALDSGYRVVLDYDLSWTCHGEFVWSYNGTQVASETFDVSALVLDAMLVETGLNARQALSIIASAVAGVLAGAAGTTITTAAAGVPATNRVTATVTSDNNRTAVTLAPPA